MPNKDIRSKFYAYLLSINTDELNIRGKGTTFLELSSDELGTFEVPVPPMAEQQTIVTFLDRETTKIDTLITEQERLIELLQEKHTALISHAVTKGLNPNVSMKDSEVEWLGEVPVHWKVLPIKRLVSTPITDGPHETPEFFDEGIPFVSAEAVAGGYIDFTKIRGYISHDDHVRYSQKYHPKKGDVYVVKSGATTGVSAIVETDQDFNIWSPLAVIRCNNLALPKFILNCICSTNLQNAIALSWTFGTQQNIGMGVLEKIQFPVPEIKEQQAIVDFLDRETAKIDTLIAKTRQAIDFLKERRTVLISAAVTGKIDVRDTIN